MTSVLVVAAHPDDEVLGCGGTIARHADASDQVQVLIVAEGATSRQQHRSRLKSCDELSALVRQHGRLDRFLVQQVLTSSISRTIVLTLWIITI